MAQVKQKDNLKSSNGQKHAPEKIITHSEEEKRLGKKKEKFSPGENPDYNAEDFSTD